MVERTGWLPNPEILRAHARYRTQLMRREGPTPPPLSAEVEQRAVDAGMSFVEPFLVDHDSVVTMARRAVSEISAQDAAAGFAVSLSGVRHLTSILASFAVVRHMPEHEFLSLSSVASQVLAWGGCAWCGCEPAPGATGRGDWLERMVGRLEPSEDIRQMAFDLWRFTCESPRHEALPDDVARLRNLLDDVRQAAAEPGLTVTQLLRRLSGYSPNPAGRRLLVHTLCVTGVLPCPPVESFRTEFIPVVKRADSGQARNDWLYPTWAWRGGYGVAEDAVAAWFSSLL